MILTNQNNLTKKRAKKQLPINYNDKLVSPLVGSNRVVSRLNLQIENCEEVLKSKFGEAWVDFKKRQGPKKYNKEFVPEVIYELASLYEGYSIYLLAQILDISRQTLKIWLKKEEVKEALADGCRFFEDRVKALGPTILWNVEALPTDVVKAMALILKGETDKMKAGKNGNTSQEEKPTKNKSKLWSAIIKGFDKNKEKEKE